MNYSIIIPLFNEEASIENLHSEICNVLENLSNDERKFELIYVNDGSQDNTLEKLLSFKNKSFEIKIINNNRNMSQSISIFNGIEESKYDNLIFLDGDGQNDPSDINIMIDKFEEGADLVHGYRKKRKDNFLLKTIPSLAANFIVRLISKSKIKDHGCSLKIIKKHFLKNEILWGDFHRLLAARIANEKIKLIQIETNHRYRKYGKSNYGLSRIFKVMIDLIYIYLFHRSYSNFYIIGYLGFFSLLLSTISLIYMIKLKLINSVSFIETPLPMVTSLFGVSSLIFFAFMFLIQTIKNLKIDLSNETKNYKVYSLK